MRNKRGSKKTRNENKEAKKQGPETENNVGERGQEEEIAKMRAVKEEMDKRIDI